MADSTPGKPAQPLQRPAVEDPCRAPRRSPRGRGRARRAERCAAQTRDRSRRPRPGCGRRGRPRSAARRRARSAPPPGRCAAAPSARRWRPLSSRSTAAMREARPGGPAPGRRGPRSGAIRPPAKASTRASRAERRRHRRVERRDRTPRQVRAPARGQHAEDAGQDGEHQALGEELRGPGVRGPPPAPSRTAISRRRPRARTSSRFATLAQARSRTSAAMAAQHGEHRHQEARTVPSGSFQKR